MSDEEVVCPKPELEETCKPQCIKYFLEYQVHLTFMWACVNVVRVWNTAGRGRLLSVHHPSLSLWFRHAENAWRRTRRVKRTALGR